MGNYNYNASFTAPLAAAFLIIAVPYPMPSLVSDWYRGRLSGLSQTMPVKGDSPWQRDHSSRVSPWPLACPYWQHCTEGRALGHSEERTL